MEQIEQINQTLQNLGIKVEESKNKWLEEEKRIVKKVVCLPDSEDDLKISYPFKIGGADLSFIPENSNKAVCCYIVVEYREDNQITPEVVWKDLKVVDLDLPYIPGLLAFREATSVIDMIKNQIETCPEKTPDYLMIDGNGINHPRKCGLACHVGVQVDLPTIGVAKNLFSLEHYFDQSEPDPKSFRNSMKKKMNDELSKPGDSVELLHPMDKSLSGLALRVSENAVRPCFISIGHKISLAKSKALTLRTSKFKTPEPTRLADIEGREYIRINFIDNNEKHTPGLRASPLKQGKEDCLA